MHAQNLLLIKKISKDKNDEKLYYIYSELIGLHEIQK